jgi:hypothetical protein
VWPHWLDIAIDHAVAARVSRLSLEEAVRDGVDDVAQLLRSESQASVVAMSGAAIALDSFHGTLRTRRDMTDYDRKWSDARTPRHARITELICATFKLENAAASQAADLVQDLFKFRDWAVHPPARFEDPVRHDVMGSAVPWWYVAFASPNATRALHNVTRLLASVLTRPKDPAGDAEWCERASKELAARTERARGHGKVPTGGHGKVPTLD